MGFDSTLLPTPNLLHMGDQAWWSLGVEKEGRRQPSPLWTESFLLRFVLPTPEVYQTVTRSILPSHGSAPLLPPISQGSLSAVSVLLLLLHLSLMVSSHAPSKPQASQTRGKFQLFILLSAVWHWNSGGHCPFTNPQGRNALTCSLSCGLSLLRTFCCPRQLQPISSWVLCSDAAGHTAHTCCLFP